MLRLKGGFSSKLAFVIVIQNFLFYWFSPFIYRQFEYQQAQLELEIENLSWKLERDELYCRGVSCSWLDRRLHSEIQNYGMLADRRGIIFFSNQDSSYYILHLWKYFLSEVIEFDCAEIKIFSLCDCPLVTSSLAQPFAGRRIHPWAHFFVGFFWVFFFQMSSGLVALVIILCS